jgi:hypothetical protein
MFMINRSRVTVFRIKFYVSRIFFTGIKIGVFLDVTLHGQSRVDVQESRVMEGDQRARGLMGCY